MQRLLVFCSCLLLTLSQTHLASFNLWGGKGREGIKETFLVPCKELRKQEILNKIKEATVELQESEDDFSFLFFTSNNEVKFSLSIFDHLPDRFKSRKTEFYTIGNRAGRKAYCFDFETAMQINNKTRTSTKLSKNKGQGELLGGAKLRHVDTKPDEITVEELVRVIQSRNILFYTGSGISKAAGVLNGKGVFEELNLVKGENLDQRLEEIVDNPIECAANIYGIHRKLFYTAPTKAHYALSEIAKTKQSLIVTENIDFLHQRTGIEPFKINRKYLRENVDPSDFFELDYIICIGLSSDVNGFLSWFKEYNPQGRIVAIDLAQPEYLDDDDFLLRADLHRTLPRLAQLINGDDDL